MQDFGDEDLNDISDIDLENELQNLLRDVPIANIMQKDDNLSDEDPDILNELNLLAASNVQLEKPLLPINSTNDLKKILDDRYKLYQEALQIAESNNDASKIKRINRGIANMLSMKDKMSDFENGKISLLGFTTDDLPPLISKGKSSRNSVINNIPHQSFADEKPTKSLFEETSEDVMRHDEYAIKTPNTNSNPSATKQISSLTTLENLGFSSHTVEANKTVGPEVIQGDLIKPENIRASEDVPNKQSNLTPSPLKGSVESEPHNLKSTTKPSLIDLPGSNQQNIVLDNNKTQNSPVKNKLSATNSIINVTTKEDLEIHGKKPQTLLEELEKRASVYLEAQQKATEGSKNRRMGRIHKQYMEAIGTLKTWITQNNVISLANNDGRLSALISTLKDLPMPPNLPALTIDSYFIFSAQTDSGGSDVEKYGVKPVAHVTPILSNAINNNAILTPQNNENNSKMINKHHLSPTAKKTLSLLTQKRDEFKHAALLAKQTGNIPQAKEYLRAMKRFDPLITACMAGQAVNISTLPKSPQILKGATSNILSNKRNSIAQSNMPIQSSSLNTLPYSPPSNVKRLSITPDIDVGMLEKILKDQIGICAKNATYYKHNGDMVSARYFEDLSLSSQQGSQRLRNHKSSNNTIYEPLHYSLEEKIIPIVRSNLELGENDMLLTIVRGIHYESTAHKEMDTYVKYEFPYPTATPQHDKTSIIYGTNNPEYNQKFQINIDRKSRALHRVFKRLSIKFEIYLKGGLFRFISGDQLFGRINFKLAPFESDACTLHTCLPIMDPNNSRKGVGGKLEIIIKMRDPLLKKQIEETKRDWLTIS